MSAFHERMYVAYIPHPPAATPWLDNGQPMDAGTAMIYASNEGHLCAESCRQLVTDPRGYYFGVPVSKTARTWANLGDGAGPSVADVDALANVWQKVSWGAGFTKRWGPYFVPCDAPSVDGSGRLVMRRIDGRIRYRNSVDGGTTTQLIVAALTRHGSPTDINQGQLDAFDSASLTTDHTSPGNTMSVSFAAADVSYDPTYPYPCRAPATGDVGASTVYLMPVWIWVCVDPAGSGTQAGPNGYIAIDSVSFYERPFQ